MYRVLTREWYYRWGGGNVKHREDGRGGGAFRKGVDRSGQGSS